MAVPDRARRSGRRCWWPSTIADPVDDSRPADVALFAIAAVVGVTAIALGDHVAGDASRRTQAEAAAQRRRDAELFDSMLRMLDDEREQVAHELHDGPQQLLAAIRLMADAIAHAVREGDEQRAAEALRRLEEHAGEAADELRQTTRRLHPVVLEQRGLLPALEALQEMVRGSVRCGGAAPAARGRVACRRPSATPRSTASPATRRWAPPPPAPRSCGSRCRATAAASS